MDNTVFLSQLRESSLEEGRAFIEAHLDELTDHAAIGDLMADEALKQLHHLSLKLSELLIFFGEITQNLYVHALGLKAKGDVLVQIRHHKAALECLDAAGEEFLSLGDKRNWARSRISWIIGATSLSRVEEALEQAARAREVFESLDELYWVCAIDHNTAWIYKQVGRYHDATLLYKHLLTVYPNIKDQSEVYIKRAIAMAKGNQATTLAWQGEFEQAYRLQQEAQDTYIELKETNMVVNSEINLANFDYTQGYYGSALRRYYQAQDILIQNNSNNPRLISDLKLQIANVLVKLNRADEACQLGYEAIEIRRRLGASLNTSNALREYATILGASGKLKEALAVSNEARELFERGGFNYHASVIQLQHAELLLEMGESIEAYTEAHTVKGYFETQGLIARSTRACLIMVGSLIEQALRAEIHLDREHQAILLQEAVSLCKQAALQARQRGLQEERYRSHYLLGRLFALQGDPAKTMRHFGASIAQIERILDNLVFDLSPSFLHTAWTVFEDTIALCLQSQQQERAFNYLERARSLALRQYLHISKSIFEGKEEPGDRFPSRAMHTDRVMILRTQDELKTWQDRYRSYSTLLTQVDTSVSPSVERGIIEAEVQQCEAKLNELFERLYLQQATTRLTPGSKKRRKDRGYFDVGQMRQRLSPNQLILAYFLYKDSLVIFVLNKEQLATCEIPDGMKQLKRLLPLLHAHLQPTGWPNPQQPPQQAIRSMLNKLYHLLIAPVQALLLPQPGCLTIVPYGPLHTLPFHALYDGSHYLIEQFEVNYLPASSIPMISVGDKSAFPSKPPLIFGYSGQRHLQRALEEAKILAALLKGHSYLEDEATIARLIEEAPGSPIIHLATHGDSRLDAPNFSSVLLAEGRFNAIDAFSLNLQDCELVTLSGCETGLALIGGGDEQLGLGRAFLAAGANTLVMSLWPVDDDATSELMQLFYQNLLHGDGKAQALRGAQCAFIHRTHSIYTHPYYWAAFRLVGDVGPLKFHMSEFPSAGHEIQSLKK